MKHKIQEIIENRRASNIKGVISICTASPLVIEASMELYKDKLSPLIIEATANQVNQEGGYTGMNPEDFRNFILGIAKKNDFPQGRIILGGDHLGPLTWVKLPEEEAMIKAEILVSQYVQAGFSKIHIDTSMRLASDDISKPLETIVIAQRGVRLMKVAEQTFYEYLKENPFAIEPVYVIGSEVPIPGGSQDDLELKVTDPKDFIETVQLYRRIMNEAGLEKVWSRIIGVVVQPGVEFGDESVRNYDSLAVQTLSQSLNEFNPIVFEGHSTDYQISKSLEKMVDDGIAILKVGPALTFALREGLFALSKIEDELIQNPKFRSNLIMTLDKVMTNNPSYWIKHYHGSEEYKILARKYSFSDRSRYYMLGQDVVSSIEKLFSNTREIYLPLLHQFMPIQYQKIRSAELLLEPKSLVKDCVKEILKDYLDACERKEV